MKLGTMIADRVFAGGWPAAVIVYFCGYAVALGVPAALAEPAASRPTASTPAVAERVEIGMLGGAPFRIDMPDKWNGILLVYYHGYSETPVAFDKNRPNRMGPGFAAAGFAVAQSGYSVTGWALEHAIPETEALREYTIAHYGQPMETYVIGHSMGGQLTLATIENYPNRYDGALALCALMEPTSFAVARSSALIAAFHHYYPGVLPGPTGIPESAVLGDELVKKVAGALSSNAVGRAELLALGHFHGDADLAGVMVFFSYIQRDFEQKIGAPILDNDDFIYAGGPDDDALNDAVHRYTASPAALTYLKTWYTPTGLLVRPTLAVHTTYDPIIPAGSVALYADLVRRTNSGDNFVQQYVKHAGHCNITGPETAAALQELIKWKRGGAKPNGGPVPLPEP